MTTTSRLSPELKVDEAALEIVVAGEQPGVPLDDRPLGRLWLLTQRLPDEVEHARTAGAGVAVEGDRDAHLGGELGDRLRKVRREGRMAERVGARITQRPIG
jgi:hypothetical protein